MINPDRRRVSVRVENLKSGMFVVRWDVGCDQGNLSNGAFTFTRETPSYARATPNQNMAEPTATHHCKRMLRWRNSANRSLAVNDHVGRKDDYDHGPRLVQQSEERDVLKDDEPR
jgi:hypothetical protein